MGKFKPVKRVISGLLAASTLLTQMPLKAYAEEFAPAEDIYLPENTMDDVILNTDVFYLPSSTIKIEEGSKSRYILRIGRGGDCASEASVNIRIADLTAKYGKDYTISAIDGEEKVEDPADNESLMERIEGEEYTVTPMISEEEFAEKMDEDPALQESAAAAINDVFTMVEKEAELKLKEESGDTAAEPADGSESVNINPLLEARSRFTQTEGEPQRVTATADMYQEIQKIANVLTSAVVGADLRVNFAEGVSERFLAVEPIDNDEGDGDRYFYLMLSNPEGSTTVSAAATCAGTVADDEEQLPSEVSFGDISVDSEKGVVSVEVKREGALNTITDVQMKTAGGRAKLGRDVSPVDMSVAFPIGIDSRTIEIPINTDNLSTAADFVITLEENAGAEVKTPEQTVTINRDSMSALMDSQPVYKAGDVSRTLATIHTEQAIDFSAEDVLITNRMVPRDSGYYYSCGSFYGINSLQSDGSWCLKWNGSYHSNLLTNILYKYNLGSGVEWKLSDYKGFEYAGVETEMEKIGFFHMLRRDLKMNRHGRIQTRLISEIILNIPDCPKSAGIR